MLRESLQTSWNPDALANPILEELLQLAANRVDCSSFGQFFQLCWCQQYCWQVLNTIARGVCWRQTWRYYVAESYEINHLVYFAASAVAV